MAWRGSARRTDQPLFWETLSMMMRLLAALLTALALGDAAFAHGEHEPQPQPLLKSVDILADHGARLDIAVGFELTNPNAYPYRVLSVSALGGAKARLEDEAGGAVEVTSPAEGAVLVAPPTARLVIQNAHKGAMSGVGLLVTLETDNVGELQMLVKLP